VVLRMRMRQAWMKKGVQDLEISKVDLPRRLSMEVEVVKEDVEMVEWEVEEVLLCESFVLTHSLNPAENKRTIRSRAGK
jgi:hypothetical protein